MNNSRLSTSSEKFIIDSKTKYALEELIKSEPLISVNSQPALRSADLRGVGQSYDFKG